MTRALRSSVLVGTVIWLLVVLLVAAIDVSTGPAYDFGFFYLVAVVPAAWLLGRGPGIAGGGAGDWLGAVAIVVAITGCGG